MAGLRMCDRQPMDGSMTINFVGDDWVSNVLHMDPKLMCAACLGVEFHMAESIESLDDLIKRGGVAAHFVWMTDLHLFAHTRMRSHVGFDPITVVVQ